MPHRGQKMRDFRAIFGRACDQDFMRMLSKSAAAGLEEGLIAGRASLNTLTILGLETSCDETAAAVVRGLPPGPGEILSNIVFSQTEAHAPYGGVVPEIASRAHLEILDGLIERALVGRGRHTGRSGRDRRHGGPRPDRRRDGGTDHGQGAGAGARASR